MSTTDMVEAEEHLMAEAIEGCLGWYITSQGKHRVRLWSWAEQGQSRQVSRPLTQRERRALGRLLADGRLESFSVYEGSGLYVPPRESSVYGSR